MLRSAIIWILVAVAVVTPIAIAAASPLLAWRDPVYIIAGFAGVASLSILLMQPLLAGAYLPGLGNSASRRIHCMLGAVLLFFVVVHVAGLWITSPPDFVDALTFTSPTPFSAWGVIAMWVTFVSALVASVRGKLRLRPKLWRRIHIRLAIVIIGCSIPHAILIEGTMGQLSKIGLCGLIVIAVVRLCYDVRAKLR